MSDNQVASSYVFVSHSSADRKLVEKVVYQIEKRGIRCWISSRDIKPGRDYQTEIVSNLENSAVVLLIFSQHANKSTEILKELSLASKFKKPMIPARTEDIVPSGPFQYQLSNAQIIDLFDNFDKKIQDLCDSIIEYMAAKGDHVSVPVRRASVTKYWPFLAGAVALAVAAGSLWAILHHGSPPPSRTASATPSISHANLITKSPVVLPVKPAMPVVQKPLVSVPAASIQTSTSAKVSAPAPVIHAAKLPTSIKHSGASASVESLYPNAKMVAWFPLSKTNDAPPSNFLSTKGAVWTVKSSTTGQIRVVILLSQKMVVLNHVVLGLEADSEAAELPNTAVISLTGSHSANPDTFRYVSTCALTSHGETRCDFGSQYARAITIELFREGKPLSDVKLSIGF